jgi:hypothetical protein
MVCLRIISVDTLHKGDTMDDDDNNNNNNNNIDFKSVQITRDFLDLLKDSCKKCRE